MSTVSTGHAGHAVPGWDDYFLGIADAVAARAKCTRRRVGAVLTIDHRIIATGYNGAAPGEDDCLAGACPPGKLGYDDVPGLGDYDRPGTPGFCIAIHAEVNALLAANWNGEGHTLFVTHEPCATCARLIVNSRRVVRVVYEQGYMETARATAGLPSGAQILRDAGLLVRLGAA